MKASTAFSSLIFMAAIAHQFTAAQQCSTSCVRTEIRLLDQATRDTYFNAVRTLQASGVYDTFTSHHLEQASWIHGGPAFFPWHRAFLRAFEVELQRINPGICLHYWAEDIDSQAPEVSPIFADGYYGGNGGSDGNGGCVGGPWANWQPRHPSPHCLERHFNGGDGSISAFPAMEVVNRVITSSSSYDEFRRAIEGSIHGSPHVNIGGDMRTMHSVNDPIFFAHHAYIDKLWWMFQRARPEMATAYDGTSRNGGSVSAGDVMTPFPQTVSQLFDTNQLCYTYAELPIDAVNGLLLPAPSVAESSDRVGAAHSSWSSATSWFSTGAETVVRSIEVNDPTDEFVRVEVLPTNTTEEYDSLDRSDLTGLRTPRELNATWVRMMNLDLKAVRADEAKNRKVILDLNEVYGYTSPSALLHRPETLIRLFPRINTFKLDYANITRVIISRDSSESDVQAVSNLLRRVQIVVPDAVIPAEALTEKVQQITGRSVIPADSASSFVTSSPVDKRVQRQPTSAAITHHTALSVVALSLLLQACHLFVY